MELHNRTLGQWLEHWADFLNYLAITNQVYLSGTSDDSKKKL